MKAAQALLCADIGTSSIKLSLIDFDGKQLCFVRESFPFDRVTGGTVTAQDWKEAFRQGIVSLKKVCSETAVTAVMKAITISGNGPTLVPVINNDVTRTGTPLQPLYWHDKRVYTPPNAAQKAGSLFLPHAAWLKHHAENEYDNVNYFLSTQEWLSYELGAEPVTILPSPSYKPFYWDDDQCRLFHLDASKFAPFAALGAEIGKVSSEAARYFDLPSGIPIVAGGPDYIMALIGTGTIESGKVCDRAGTSEGINVCTDSPIYVPELRTLPHIKNGLWNINAMIPQSGKLFEWFRDMTGQTHRPYAEMMQEIIGSLGFDCLGFSSPSAEADFFFSGNDLSPESTSSVQMGRSIIESIGFMVLDALQSLQSHGFTVTEMCLSGGQAKNPLWNQLKANICGCTLHVPSIIDAELAGNACLALIHLGEARNIDEACRKVVKIQESYYADETCHKHYLEQFASYNNVINDIGMLFS
jgi:xylulokinase